MKISTAEFLTHVAEESGFDPRFDCNADHGRCFGVSGNLNNLCELFLGFADGFAHDYYEELDFEKFHEVRVDRSGERPMLYWPLLRTDTAS